MSLGELPPSINYRGYYRCENGNDSSGNGNNLSNLNSGVFVLGKFNNGYSTGTTGTTKALATVTNVMSTLKIPNITLSFWFKLNSNASTGANKALCQIDTDGASTGCLQSYFYSIAGGILSVSAQTILTTTNATTTYNFTSLPSINDWISFIAIKRSTTIMDLYINGNFVATSTGSGTDTSAGSFPQRFSMGNNRNLTSQSFATFDEVIIEERSWSASEIRKYYTQSKGRFQTMQ